MWTSLAPVLLACALLLLACFIALVIRSKSAGAGGKIRAHYRYARKNFFMDRAEHQFFDALVEVVGDSYYVFPQVHYSSILEHKIPGQYWRAALRHINQKSVDFVICDKAYIKPLIAIELDGKSHDMESVRLKDEREQSMFQGADMKLIRFANHGSPSKDEIRQRVFEALASIS